MLAPVFPQGREDYEVLNVPSCEPYGPIKAELENRIGMQKERSHSRNVRGRSHEQPKYHRRRKRENSHDQYKRFCRESDCIRLPTVGHQTRTKSY
jgi:hypothetical protein